MTTSAIEALLHAALVQAAGAEQLLVACDFDGTLAPIVAHRDDARALPDSLEALRILTQLDRTTVAVVSGRALADLVAVGRLPEGVLLVGSHGAELDDAPQDDVAEKRDALIDAVRSVTTGVPGVDLETKPAGVAVHVRAAARSDAARVLDALRAGPAQLPGVVSMPGKEVLELSVVSTDKGEALDVLRRRTGATATVFLGDDRTDESAFTQLRPSDVGVKVGPGPTAAEHRVPDPQVVADALAVLAEARAAAVRPS